MTKSPAITDPGPIRWLQIACFALLVRPLVWLILGVNLRGADRLPRRGPAVICANHNSHLDTLVLMSLFPLARLHAVRPVAAADYFLRNRLLAWVSLRIIGILPLERRCDGHRDPLALAQQALERGEILLIFPEGSRGDPERPARLKPGIAHLARRLPRVPLIPVHLEGLGKALPRGEGLLVPFICDIWVGEALFWGGDRGKLLGQLKAFLCRRPQQGSSVGVEQTR
jgi:1-acyl-sn-glycerol-3-phosphate acyltransferase